jgi:hypothetical protein
MVYKLCCTILIELKNKPVKKNIVALALLFVLAVSVAPKTYFHDLIADHKDVLICDHSCRTSSHLHQQGFNCHFDDFVVTAPYVFQSCEILFSADNLYQDLNSGYTSSLLQYGIFYKDTRGPPSV